MSEAKPEWITKLEGEPCTAPPVADDRHGHCPACLSGQDESRGEGTHLLGTIEHPAPVAGKGAAMKWIDCNQEKPPTHEAYRDGPLTSGAVLTFNGHYVSVGSYEQTCSKRIWGWKGRNGQSASITHWMPLPAPPRRRDE